MDAFGDVSVVQRRGRVGELVGLDDPKRSNTRASGGQQQGGDGGCGQASDGARQRCGKELQLLSMTGRGAPAGPRRRQGRTPAKRSLIRRRRRAPVAGWWCREDEEEAVGEGGGWAHGARAQRRRGRRSWSLGGVAEAGRGAGRGVVAGLGRRSRARRAETGRRRAHRRGEGRGCAWGSPRRCGRAEGIEDWGCERIGRRALPVDVCVCVREGGGGIERRRRPEGEMGIGLGLTVG